MIVVVHKPNPEKGYYGNTVAAPVFKAVAEYIYGKMPKQEMLAEVQIPKLNKTETIVEKYKTIMPDLKGLPAKDALYILENMGLIVRLNGSGKVVKQSIPRGERIKKNQLIELKLS
jgi:cell division protein FtsI (penicillin-binding protein 3)